MCCALHVERKTVRRLSDFGSNRLFVTSLKNPKTHFSVTSVAHGVETRLLTARISAENGL